MCSIKISSSLPIRIRSNDVAKQKSLKNCFIWNKELENEAVNENSSFIFEQVLKVELSFKTNSLCNI